jgi:flagellar basal-body rod protein FlgB
MKLPGDISAFQLLSARLNMLETRQKTVAENVANANTPGFVPRDVDQSDFARSLSGLKQPRTDSVGLSVTRVKHIASDPVSASAPGVSLRNAPDSEVTMDGNAVVVEEQMLKINQIRSDFDTAISLYQKGLAMMRLAARSPN